MVDASVLVVGAGAIGGVTAAKVTEEALEVAMRQAGATKASMLQDLERGVETEVDVINGAVVAKGREFGVETSLNARVVDLMHSMERGERPPGRDVFGELRELT